jgi:hypothetical protein
VNSLGIVEGLERAPSPPWHAVSDRRQGPSRRRHSSARSASLAAFKASGVGRCSGRRRCTSVQDGMIP